MTTHVRTGMALALVFASVASAACLFLNPRFVDSFWLGLSLFVAIPLVAGAALGPIVGGLLTHVARVGSSEAPGRACRLLWATLAGSAVFCTTLPFLPPYLSMFWSSEAIRYGGAVLVAGGLAWVVAEMILHIANRRWPWAWAALLALPVAVVVAGGTEQGRGKGQGSRVLVLAFPGLSWSVAEDMIERGEMPRLAELRRRGAWGDVRSPRPLLTPVVWTSVATGKESSEHGVMSFTATARDVEARRIWEIFEDRGWSIGLFGWPVTWPPPPVDGFVVPAISDMGTETHPHQLGFIRELAMEEKTRQRRTWGRYCRYAFQAIRYGARFGTLIHAGGQIVLDPLRGRSLDTAQLFAKRKVGAQLGSDYFVDLRRTHPVDFAAYWTNIIHVAQSYFWKYHEPERFVGTSPQDIARYGDSVHEAYRIVDEFIGKILDSTTGDDLVVIVSDHGAEAASDDQRRTLALRVEPVLLQMRLKDTVEATNVGARTFLRMKRGQEGNQDRVQRFFETARLDRAGFGAFHSRVDEWGNVVVTVRHEVVDHLDDTLLFQGGRCLVSEAIRAVEFQESAQMKETGALVIAGKGVVPGRRFEGASLLDIVPTLLVLNGLDLAADLPGDVIYAALSDEYRDIIPGFVATYEEAAPPDAAPPAN
ncbi:MAG: alkaline phosphatase family protein [bacterium]